MLGEGNGFTRNNSSIEVAKSKYNLIWLCGLLKSSYWQVKSNTSSGSLQGWHPGLEWTEWATSGISSGKAFQSRTVHGKKDIFLVSVLQLMVWNVLHVLWSFFVLLLGGTNLLSLLMATSYLSCTACRGEHPSICPVGTTSLNTGACHSHLICSGVCWCNSMQTIVVPSRPSEYFPGCKDPASSDWQLDAK